MTSTFHNEITLGDINYRLATTVDSEESLVLDLLGTTESGEVVADGRLRLPVEGGGTVGKLLTRVLSAHARLRSRPNRHANANRPWTQSLDDELREAWLQPGGGSALDRIDSLAKHMERSKTAIRARLPRVGCDPDVVGRELSDTAAAVLGVEPPAVKGNT
ncbi:hypothetical protein SK571_30760 [Lentzea sp. BCCO 10_0798]|uniref:Uncharacterized protein n=2 Tax=Lentzea TaxID=165301 RepID=A0A1G9Z498_9PSEU|nr:MULTISPECIES: hypothetical protein [Lentzea]MDX8053772.1 hypothetical protein [Lentzea sp. BCCO 10_0798]SDN16172.1 hypothetical protein SAMN04488074_13720 [Lentzea albidocapillata subsp. violacea]